MMRILFAAIVALTSLCWSIDAGSRPIRGVQPVATNQNLRQGNFFGINEAAWQSFTGNYTPGYGNPAVSTDDWYHENGLSGFRPYDMLDPACGAAGASIAATKGRYAWVLSPDHGNGLSFTWNGSFDLRVGYSNDPGVPPSRMNFIYTMQNPNPSPVISTITASISNGSGGAGNILNVTAYTGLITNAGQATVSGAGMTTATITSQSTGTGGQTGTYVINGAAQLVASQTMSVNQTNYVLYYDATFVCNPDDPSTPFYIYSEGSGSAVQHQMGVIKSGDMVSWTAPVPTHNALNFGTWSSFQRIQRVSTGNWYSKGLQAFYFLNGNVFARSTWTSTDGNVWAPGTVNLNNCIPASAQVGTTTSCTGTNVLSLAAAQSPSTITVGGTTWQMGKLDTYTGGSRQGNQWVGRASVDSNQSVVDSPAPVMVSTPYAGVYPGPSYLQVVTGYAEDGIGHYYAVKGWPISATNWGAASGATYMNNGLCTSVPVANGTQGLFQLVGSISGTGTVLTVSSVTINSVVIGGQIYGGNIGLGNRVTVTGQISGTPGGAGDYNITMQSPTNLASSTITGALCGGMWQQNLDYYTEIIDPIAAAGAAPIGVRASCSSSTSIVNWYVGALPTDTMRLYRGSSAGSQPTLVGDFTGGTATDTGMTLNAVTYYKLVYLNGGVEQKNRVVSTYCSSSIYPEVNAHMTRALAEGADPATCDRSKMDAFYALLTAQGLKNNLLFATMPEFCVAQSGGVISKIFDMGTTRLPRGGDYTTMTSSTTYNATGISGTLPAWVNGTNTAKGYYGSDRSYLNNIRRKTQITIFSAYQKPGTGQAMFLASGQFTNRMYLSHDSGSPGTISCAIYDASQQKIATATPVSATAFNTAACTYSSTNGWIAYSNAVGGTPQTGLVIPSPNLDATDALTGQIGSGNLTNVLVAGDAAGLYARTTGAFSSQGNLAQYSGRAMFIFDIEATPTQVSAFDAFVR